MEETMRPTTLSRFLTIALVAASLAGSIQAHAQAYPTKPVTLIVPYAPGGPADFVARLAAEFMGKALGGATLVLEHRGGAGGVVGTAAVAKAEGDGYTLCVC